MRKLTFHDAPIGVLDYLRQLSVSFEVKHLTRYAIEFDIGKQSVDAELSGMRNLVDSLNKRITDMNEKMYDFEQNKVGRVLGSVTSLRTFMSVCWLVDWSVALL